MVWTRPPTDRDRERLFQVEFHPRDEILKITDFKRDGDAVYVTVSDRATGIQYGGAYRAPSGKRNQSFDFNFREGRGLDIRVYDGWNSATQKGKNQLGALDVRA